MENQPNKSGKSPRWRIEHVANRSMKNDGESIQTNDKSRKAVYTQVIATNTICWPYRTI
jgi:hypothetical protein